MTRAFVAWPAAGPCGLGGLAGAGRTVRPCLLRVVVVVQAGVLGSYPARWLGWNLAWRPRGGGGVRVRFQGHGQHPRSSSGSIVLAVVGPTAGQGPTCRLSSY